MSRAADQTVTVPTLFALQYDDLLRAALQEDLGRAGDVTSNAVVSAGARARGAIRARQAGRVAGVDVAARAFTLLDPGARVTIDAPDGVDVGVGATILTVEGDARALLAAERTALNLLGRLCGIATTTRDLVAHIEGTGATVVGTRKTTPLLRALEKHAVRCGGGSSHRFGLDDAVLIKDNHRVLAGSAAEAVRRAQATVGHMVKIEVEIDHLEELAPTLALGVDAVLLDNMTPDQLRQAVAINREINGGRAVLEASGGITPETARAMAETGVDVLSLGWLTHSAPGLDIGLDFEARPASNGAGKRSETA